MLLQHYLRITTDENYDNNEREVVIAWHSLIGAETESGDVMKLD